MKRLLGWYLKAIGRILNPPRKQERGFQGTKDLGWTIKQRTNG